jgi:hypothetical protein
MPSGNLYHGAAVCNMWKNADSARRTRTEVTAFDPVDLGKLRPCNQPSMRLSLFFTVLPLLSSIQASVPRNNSSYELIPVL